MSKAKAETNELTRTEQIQEQMTRLSARDLHIWSITLLSILVVVVFLVAFIMPSVMWNSRIITIEGRYLPQLLFGLISLILLFNISVLNQKLALNTTRQVLIGELALNERLETLSLVDPMTQLLNRHAINQLVPKEVARANRMGGNLTFMKIDVTGFNEINAKFGSGEGNSLLVEFAKLLKSVFRGGDTVFRQAGHEFMVVLPDTSEPQCDPPLERLLRAVEQWNLNNNKPYELSFRWAFAGYPVGADFEDTLRTLDRKIYVNKNTLLPAF